MKAHEEKKGQTPEEQQLEFQTLFAEADADGDKLLNLPEYLVFCGKDRAAREARGETLPTRTDA